MAVWFLPDRSVLLAIEEGMRTMRDDGIQKVRDGVSTLAEVTRVTSG